MKNKIKKPQIKYVVLGIVSLAVAVAALIALVTCTQINPQAVADYLELFIMFIAAGALGVIICTVGYLTLNKSANQTDTEKRS